MYSFHEGYQQILGVDIGGIPNVTSGVMNAKPMKEILDLSGKTAIVTGGAMGMGFCTVNRLCEAGASVVIADVAEEFADKNMEYLASKGYKVKFIKTDVRDVGQIQAAVDFAVKELGGVDILVNDAAVWSHRLLSEVTEATWDEIVDINLKGSFFFVQAVVKQMEKQGRGGKIVNVASVAAFSNDTQPLMFEYVASKSGVVALTKSMAKALQPLGIQINCVVPGGMITPGAITTQRSKQAEDLEMPPCPVADPDEVARVTFMLATGISDFMQGAVVAADGGELVRVQAAAIPSVG